MSEIQEILTLLLNNPLAAADRMDALADRLHAEAVKIRTRAQSPWASPGGAMDRATLNVIGPDGRLKQRGLPNGE
jgi:hypothetical protein